MTVRSHKYTEVRMSLNKALEGLKFDKRLLEMNVRLGVIKIEDIARRIVCVISDA